MKKEEKVENPFIINHNTMEMTDIQRYYDHIQQNLDKQITQQQKQIIQRHLTYQKKTLEQLKQNFDDEIINTKKMYSDFTELLDPMLKNIENTFKIDIDGIMQNTKILLENLKK